jgi:glycosyltransferase involved in cell wall biosynthesis
MRVTIVNPVWSPAHATPEATLAQFTTLTGWAEALRAGGAAVTVHQRFITDRTIEQNGVSYEFRATGGPPHPRIWARGAPTFHQAIARTRADLVHVNGVLHPELLCMLRTTLPASTALVAQDHGGLDLRSTRNLLRRWIRRGLRAADALLISAPGQEQIWRDMGAAPAETPILAVMEGSTTLRPVPRDEARRSSRIEGSPALLWVGRLTAQKDPLTVLDGVARFFERHPEARLTMAYQDASLEPEVRARCASIPTLHGRVALLGSVPHDALAAYYSAADLFVSGSHAEGSGYAAIEALACGAVPVLTAIPSFKALTGDGTVGALWMPGDPRSLDAALERMWSGMTAARRDAARALFESRFSWSAIGRRALEIYAEVSSPVHRRTPS